MGYAIIKGGARAYALNRQVQNLTPVDSEYRKNLAADVVATYGSEIDGVYRVTSINLGEATQPYIYALVNSSGNDKTYTGVSINQISGAITTSAEYTGEAVYVKIKPQIVANYYTTAASTSAFEAIVQHEVAHTASLNSFTYTIDGGTGLPQGLTSSETTLTLTLLNITYDGNPVVIDNLNTIPSELTEYSVTAYVDGTNINVAKATSTLKSLIIVENTSTNYRDIRITLSAKYNGCFISSSYVIPQAGKSSEAVTSISVANKTLQEFSSLSDIKATTNLGTEVDVTVIPDVVLPGNRTYTATYNNISTTFSINSTDLLDVVSVISLNSALPSSITANELTEESKAASSSSNMSNNLLYIGSTDSASDVRKHYKAVVNTAGKKYYYLNPVGDDVHAALFDGDVLEELNSSSSNSQVTYTNGAHDYNEDTNYKVVIFNVPEGAHTIFFSTYGCGSVSPLFKELSF